MNPIEIILLVLVVLALALHFIPAKDLHSTLIAKAQKDIDDVYEWILAHLDLHAAQAREAALTPASAPAPVVPPAPPGAPAPIPAAPPSFNGMLVPEGMDLASFTQLGLAVQGASAQLHPEFAQYLISGSQAWWNGLGTYFREALLNMATGDVLTALRTKASDPSAPALLSVTAGQWAAAKAATAST